MDIIKNIAALLNGLLGPLFEAFSIFTSKGTQPTVKVDIPATIINDDDTITTPEAPIVIPSSKYKSFDKNDFVPDSWWFDYKSRFDCQKLLEERKSSLAKMKINGQSVGDVIVELGKKIKINPKIAIITLEREQSLVRVSVDNLASKQRTYQMRTLDGAVTTVTCSLKEYRLDWACGFGCPDKQPRLEKYRGVDKQIAAMMERYKQYAIEIDTGKFKLGAPYNVDLGNDGKWHDKVYPVNKATFSNYRYCPHIGGPNSPLYKDFGGEYGNYLTWLLMVKVFFKSDF